MFPVVTGEMISASKRALSEGEQGGAEVGEEEALVITIAPVQLIVWVVVVVVVVVVVNLTMKNLAKTWFTYSRDHFHHLLHP